VAVEALKFEKMKNTMGGASRWLRNLMVRKFPFRLISDMVILIQAGCRNSDQDRNIFTQSKFPYIDARCRGSVVAT
jgi:hypothetical protein